MFTYHLLKTMGEVMKKVHQLCLLKRCEEFIRSRGLGHAVGEIGPQGVMKQIRVLGHQRNLAQPRRNGDIIKGSSIDRNAT